jgi:hypothetical protein
MRECVPTLRKKSRIVRIGIPRTCTQSLSRTVSNVSIFSERDRALLPCYVTNYALLMQMEGDDGPLETERRSSAVEVTSAPSVPPMYSTAEFDLKVMCVIPHA